MPGPQNALGELLRARRGQVDPAYVGISHTGRRRVRGLRREELATLAGVSVDYYTRLAQGRDRHPSPSILDALARVLQLDDDARGHLCRLAEPPPQSNSLPRSPDLVRPEIHVILAAWTEQPALVINGYLDVLY